MKTITTLSGTVTLFGFDITPRKVYRQTIMQLKAENKTLKDALADKTSQLGILENTVDEMVKSNLELRMKNKTLREQLPTRGNNGRFTKKNNTKN